MKPLGRSPDIGQALRHLAVASISSDTVLHGTNTSALPAPSMSAGAVRFEGIAAIFPQSRPVRSKRSYFTAPSRQRSPALKIPEPGCGYLVKFASPYVAGDNDCYAVRSALFIAHRGFKQSSSP